MVKKNVSKKSIKKAQSNAKKMTESSASYIDWKIPAAFVAGILVTVLYYHMPLIADIAASNTTTGAGQNTLSGVVPTLFILNDPSCALCDDSWIEPRVSQDLNVTIQRIDSRTPQGQSLISSLEIASLPAVFFSGNFEETDAFEDYFYSGWVDKKGDYYVIKVQGAKDLTKQESANPKIDVFVMSMCPHGSTAQKNMIALKKAIPGFELDMHYIVDIQSKAEFDASSAQLRAQYDSICASPELAQNYGLSCTEAEWEQRINPASNCELKGDNYYCSLSGAKEIDTNIVQICAMNLSSNWKEFILAHIDSNFNETYAANISGISVEDLNNCANSTLGLQLLNERIKLSNELEIGASPTYIFDNIYFNPQMDPATVLCTLHPQLSGCESISSLEIAESSGSC